MTTDAAGGSLHERLRDATAPLHRATEAAFDADDRLATMAGYVDLLDRLWSLHAGVEDALRSHGCSLPGLALEALRRSPLLAHDIETLAGRSPRLPRAGLAYASPEAALGGIYVVEGSILGGRVLMRRAERSLGVSATQGGRFLAGDGAGTGARWRAFLAALAALPAAFRRVCGSPGGGQGGQRRKEGAPARPGPCPVAGAAADAAEGGARATFAAFLACFAEPMATAPA